MADKTLVEGAQRLANASSQFVDYGSAIVRNLDKNQEESRVRNADAKVRVKELNRRVQNNYNKLDGNVDFTGLKGQQLADTKDAAAAYVREYHEAADENARINDPMSPASKDAQNRMNDAQQKIVAMKNGLDTYADKMKMYNGARKSYSGAGGNEEALTQGNYIFGIDDEPAKFEFDENGNLGFGGESGVTNIVDYSMPLSRATDEALVIPNALSKIQGQQVPLDLGAKTAYAQTTMAMLRRDGVMESFLGGDFNDDVMNTLFDGIEYNPEDEEGTAKAMSERIMNEYELAATRGVDAKRQAERAQEAKKKPTDQETKQNRSWITAATQISELTALKEVSAPNGNSVAIVPAGVNVEVGYGIGNDGKLGKPLPPEAATEPGMIIRTRYEINEADGMEAPFLEWVPLNEGLLLTKKF